MASLIWSTASPAYGVTALVFSLLVLFVFGALVTEKWVKLAADVYAHRLLEPTDVMVSRSQY